MTKDNATLTLSFKLTDERRTTSIVLGDIDKDGDLDIVAGNFGQPNRVYLNDGMGHFGSGEDIGTAVLEFAVDPSDTRGGDRR